MTCRMPSSSGGRKGTALDAITWTVQRDIIYRWSVLPYAGSIGPGTWNCVGLHGWPCFHSTQAGKESRRIHEVELYTEIGIQRNRCTGVLTKIHTIILYDLPSLYKFFYWTPSFQVKVFEKILYRLNTSKRENALHCIFEISGFLSIEIQYKFKWMTWTPYVVMGLYYTFVGIITSANIQLRMFTLQHYRNQCNCTRRNEKLYFLPEFGAL